MKKLLTEVMAKNSLKLVEGTGNVPRKGCLGTMKGICADYKNPTRNGNFYSRKLWENVFKDPLVKESLEDRVLLGEVDHPLDGRLETQAKLAAIVMTDYEFDDANNTLVGSFDILDTPQGQILKSLLDYGCKIGVSSRGEGDVTTKDGVNYVDEEGFNFVGFDAVVLPAVKSAKPALQESLTINDAKVKSLKESLSEQINSAVTKNELDLIKKVIDTTNLPDSDSLIESINIKSKQLEGINSSSNLISDLEEVTNQNKKLKAEVKRLKEEVTACKSHINSTKATSKELSESTSKEMNDLMNQYKTVVIESSIGSHKLEKATKQLGKALRSSVILKNKSDNLLKENTQLSRALDSSRQSLTEKTDEINSLKESLTETKNNLLRMKKSGKEELNSLNESLELERRTNEDLTNEISSLKSELTEQTSKLNEATDQLKKKDEEILRLNESITKEKSKVVDLTSDSNKLKSNLKESVNSNYSIVREYAKQKSKDYGLDENIVLESVNPNSTIESVNTLIESIKDKYDRYSKLPMTVDPSLIKSTKVKASISPKMSEEDQQTLLFLNSVYKK